MPLPSTVQVAILINAHVIRTRCGDCCAFLLAEIELPEKLALQCEIVPVASTLLSLFWFAVCWRVATPTADEVALMASPPAKMASLLGDQPSLSSPRRSKLPLCELILACRTPSS